MSEADSYSDRPYGSPPGLPRTVVLSCALPRSEGAGGVGVGPWDRTGSAKGAVGDVSLVLFPLWK